MRKSLVALLVALLFLLSSCYSYKDIEQARDEVNDQWLSDYSALEERCYEAEDLNDQFFSDMNIASEYLVILYSYFEQEDDVTFDQAHDAYDSLHSILIKYY